MAKTLELAKYFEPFTVIPSSISVAEGQKLLKDAQVDFAVIGDTQQPQTLVLESDLAKLASAQQRPILEVLEQLPPLVTIDGKQRDLNSDEVALLSLLLDRTGSPGVVVYQDKQVMGVISTDAIAAALPLSAISSKTVKGQYGGLAGNPVVPASIYICRKCAASNPPPPFAAPREGGEAPPCPRYWFHGPMQREDA